jgi:hypothetical protein
VAIVASWEIPEPNIAQTTKKTVGSLWWRWYI